jgi:hypothetical protein
MGREHWFDLRAYAELDSYSMHIDSVLCHAAHHSGIREHVLIPPVRIYHMEHATGSGWTPEGAPILRARLEKAGIPQLTDADLAAIAVRMRRERRPLLLNGPDWGLASDRLPETTVWGQPGSMPFHRKDR